VWQHDEQTAGLNLRHVGLNMHSRSEMRLAVFFVFPQGSVTCQHKRICTDGRNTGMNGHKTKVGVQGL
jgi:hypothetical protein